MGTTPDCSAKSGDGNEKTVDVCRLRSRDKVATGFVLQAVKGSMKKDVVGFPEPDAHVH